MKKGYLIGQITITDPKKYQKYASKTENIIKSFGGRYLVRGGDQIIAEGTPQGNRDVVVEFDTRKSKAIFWVRRVRKNNWYSQRKLNRIYSYGRGILILNKLINFLK